MKNKITEYKSNDVKQYPVFIKLNLKESRRKTETITQFYLIVCLVFRKRSAGSCRVLKTAAVLMINNSNLVSHGLFRDIANISTAFSFFHKHFLMSLSLRNVSRGFKDKW